MAIADAAGAAAVRADDAARRWYKYMTRATARIVLANRTLRWSTPGTLNDPFDNQFAVPIDVDHARLRRRILQQLWEGYVGEAVPAANALGLGLQLLRRNRPDLTRAEFEAALGPRVEEGLARGNRALLQLRDELRASMVHNKLLCLSQSCDSTLMWAHYAEGHRGVVLRFRCAPGVDSPWPAGRAVNYVAQMPRLLNEQLLIDIMSGRANIDAHAMLRELVFSKSMDWAYESEWRIWTGNGRMRDAPHEDIRFNAQELDAAIVGAGMPAADREEFTALVARHYPHAEMLQVNRREGAFELIIGPLP